MVLQNAQTSCFVHFLSLNAAKPVFGISNKVRLKPVSLATETNQKIEISPVASLDMIPSQK